MKRRIVLFIMCQLLFTLPVFSANGDISGNIYSTDIKAIINGVEVESYNIGGKTVVVLEDITTPYNCTYSDYYRTLKFFTLSPSSLVSGRSQFSTAVGKVIGNTFETDIKTSIYGAEIPSYNIGGKTAVAIEDLGKHNEFSDIGGKYTWDDKNRVISLEFMYESDYGSILKKNKADMTITFDEVLSSGRIEIFGDGFECGGGSATFNWPEWFFTRDKDKELNKMIPLVASIDGEEEVVGYHFYRTIEKNDWNTQGFTAFTYVYEDKFNDMAEKIVMPEITREDVIKHYENNHIGNVVERYDTPEYSFLFMGAGTPHGGTHYLLLVNDDGTYHNYSDDFESMNIWGTKRFEDVKIDREEDKVYLRYDFDYEIDLKTGIMRKID